MEAATKSTLSLVSTRDCIGGSLAAGTGAERRLDALPAACCTSQIGVYTGSSLRASGGGAVRYLVKWRGAHPAI